MQAVAELLRVVPVLLQAEVEHGVVGISGHLFDDVEELGEALLELLALERGVGLEEHQATAAGVAGLLVDVELKVLIVHQEATTPLEDGEVRVVLLCQHVQVVTLCQLSLHFDRLTVNVGTTCRVDVTKRSLISHSSVEGQSEPTSSVRSARAYASGSEHAVRSTAGSGGRR